MKTCRLCGASGLEAVVSLGKMPLANAYLSRAGLDAPEQVYSLDVYVCTACFLMQLEAMETPEKVFSDYAYFSSYAETWKTHVGAYAREMIHQLGLTTDHLVVEIASNDGILLQGFSEAGIPVLGIEPAGNVAAVARAAGIPTREMFFGSEAADRLTREGPQADLIAANNVLAHVPDLNDFIDGLKQLLKPGGVLTVEFPHLLNLISQTQFDTIYHEHFSYFSLATALAAFRRHDLSVWDVRELETHGGSLRLFVSHAADARQPSQNVGRVLAIEDAAGLQNLETYRLFARRVAVLRQRISDFFHTARRDGKSVAGYGAPAKGNTLLNYCGVDASLMSFTVDRSDHKQGKFLPGSRIPVEAPEKIFEARPDYIFILPWNLKNEIMNQMKKVREWKACFVVPVPELEVIA